MKMVDMGADVNCRDVGGYSPMELAVYRDDYQMGRSGSSGGGSNNNNDNNNNQKQKSDSKISKKKHHGDGEINPNKQLERRLENIAVTFIGLGCDLGSEAQGRQLIWNAAAKGWSKFLKALVGHPKPGQSCKGSLGKELMLKCPSWHGCSALWISVQRGHLEAVKVLLRAGSLPDKIYTAVSVQYYMFCFYILLLGYFENLCLYVCVILNFQNLQSNLDRTHMYTHSLL
jgi:hypothetical protein